MLRINRGYETLHHLKALKRIFTKKHLNSSILLAIMAVAILGFATSFLFSSANATYLEGSITKDTLWTLVDSPFVLSNDVTVYPNATLTIERGVEVRFGGNFTLTVNGRLIANGTQDNMITFTSNKYQPMPKDWNAIELNGAGTSLLAYCSINYANNGMQITNGVVEVKNSIISNSSSNGIFVQNGVVTIEANEISNNLQSGINVAGDNQIIIQNNTLRSNGDGILLSGNILSASITQNVISSNTQSGIHLDADTYSNVNILYNVLSSNNMGFYVSGSTTTLITNNSISYNAIGISYASGFGHVAHFNDIYGNTMGMTVLSDATVNAMYNYWGDPSGPYHASLNPAGKGDPVGGDGVNLDFIFFLTAPIGYINQRPVARLLADKIHVSQGQQVTFFATNSTDDRRVNNYFFDFGDGQNSGWTTLSVFVHKYSSLGTFSATVQVMDDFGVVSNNLASSVIICQILPPLTVSLIPSSLSISSGGQVSVTVQVMNATSSVDNANVILFSILGGGFSSSSGFTNSSGYFETMFSAPNVTVITNIRMITSASKTGYVDGSDYEYLLIQPPLGVNVTINPGSIKSEATASVSVRVTYSGAPVSDAVVSVSSNSTGRFDQTSGVTGTNGTCTFVFTAPQTSTQLEINIAATATKSSYLDGQGQALLTIEPKVLLVRVLPGSSAVDSEMSSGVIVRVAYDGNPISNASVVISSDKGGSFSPTSGTTDASGQCVINFTAPQVTTPTNVTITATATKVGYAQGMNQTIIAVNLGTLNVQVSADPVGVDSRATSQVTVHVTYNGQPVTNVAVNVSSGINGTFAVATGITDSNGDCVFTFTAPETSIEFSLAITAKATKTGYLDGQGQMSMVVRPGGSSLSLLMIIAIVAVILVIVIVLILIKLKVIVISHKGE
ncbi:MAG TPA: right-handed parallel beta-helix repeat-containing protein [Candidatus Krumholzibacteriaceae bacterium]|nr:right-handed parallel beta-helix repeat-containing protein [Candidatus Krumholzibacteriaceae bacterium]